MKVLFTTLAIILYAYNVMAEGYGNTQGTTADDQNMTQKDTDLTRMIRQKITDDNTLSVNAHNIKIISENGRILLKGTVASSVERQKVESIAKSVAGKTAVTNKTVISK